MFFDVLLIVGRGLGVLTGLRSPSGRTLNVFDATDVFEDIFQPLSFIFQSRGSVFTLQQFQKLLEVFATGFLFRDGSGELPFGEKIAGLQEALLRCELFAQLRGLKQQSGTGWIGGCFELAHSQEEFLELGVLSGELALLLFEFLDGISGGGFLASCAAGDGQGQEESAAHAAKEGFHFKASSRRLFCSALVFSRT